MFRDYKHRGDVVRRGARAGARASEAKRDRERATRSNQRSSSLDARSRATLRVQGGPGRRRCSPRSSSRSSASAWSWSTAPAPSRRRCSCKDPQFLSEAAGVYAVGRARCSCGASSRIDYHRYRRSPTRSSRSSTAAPAPVRRSASVTPAAARRAGSRSGPIHIQPAEMAKLALVAVARVLAREEGREDQDASSSASCRTSSWRASDVPLHEAAGLRQRRRAPAPDVHDAVRGRRQGRLHRSALDPRRRSSARCSSSRDVPLAAQPRVARHGRAPPGPRLPAVPVGDELRLGRRLGPRPREAACRCCTCPRRTPISSPPSSARSSGFVGILGLCAAYLVIVSRGVRVALAPTTTTAAYLAFGISTMFGVQALDEPRGGAGHLPTKGLTLPFLSYGGSSLLVNAVGGGHPAQRLAAARRDACRDAPRAGASATRPRRARRWSPSAGRGQRAWRRAGRGDGAHRRRRHRRARLSRARRRRRAARASRGRAGRLRRDRARHRDARHSASAATSSSCSTSSRSRAAAWPAPSRALARAALDPRGARRSCGASRRARSSRVGGYAAAGRRSPRARSACRSRSSSRTACSASRIGCSRPFAKRAYVAFPRDRALLPARASRCRTACRFARAFTPEPYVPPAGRIARARARRQPGRQGAQRDGARARSPRSRGRCATSSVVHQAGRDRDEAVRGPTQQLGLAERATVVPFIDDIAAAARAAPISSSVARARASLAELCAVGRAVDLVPFPHAADDHQRKNAESLGGRAPRSAFAQSEPTSRARDRGRRPRATTRAGRAWPTRARARPARRGARDRARSARARGHRAQAGARRRRRQRAAAIGCAAARRRTHQAGAA